MLRLPADGKLARSSKSPRAARVFTSEIKRRYISSTKVPRWD
ncbi:MAG: hypothetical protein U9R27_10545 [Campylobacterota bacterium]|nr:hypothetical protein [Campylobacterota bacterium]